MLLHCQEKLRESGADLSKAGVVEMALKAMYEGIKGGGKVGFFSMGTLREMLSERSFQNAQKALCDILAELESGRLSADELKEGNYHIKADPETKTITVTIGGKEKGVGFLPLFPEEVMARGKKETTK